ncbi:hypothetical protein [Roseimaritima ulvae]|uniref:hypothetical protein n=1 Tax=Roseimaritima ulvae TaxID=980254 RepID=UPI0011CE9DF2|nr:hypothetical protein [Roseimaritima ulvae]
MSNVEGLLEPKRSVWLFVCSVIVLAACLVSISLALAAFAVTWDPCSIMGGVLMLPPPLALAVQQYRGTFRFNAKAASVSAVLLFLVCGLAFAALATTLVDLVFSGVRIPWLSLFLPLLVIGTLGGVSASVNLAWSRHLERATNADGASLERTQYTMRELLVAVAAIACMTTLVIYLVRSTPPRFAENVSRDEAPFGLPAEATEVSFCQGFRGTIAYEFTIDESGFVVWVESGIGSLESASANVSVQPITTPYSVRRYDALTAKVTGAGAITITDGLYYEWSKEDRGVYAAFDRTTNRAYYYAHFH